LYGAEGHLVGYRRLIRCLRLAAAPWAGYAVASTAYVVGLTVAAALPRVARPHAPGHVLPRFDLLVPAHDEVLTLPRLLRSIEQLDYPKDLVRLHVIADNCTDETASVGREGGALVYERFDPERVGKGHALAYGIEVLLTTSGGADDGVVIIDADSELAPDFLRVLAGYLATGVGAIQAYYSVSNAEDSPASMLRYVALCLYHYVRPLGRSRLGLSAGLRGNGMCFTRAVLSRVGWESHGLAEDVEQHFRLLEHGVHVAFAPEAVIQTEMPVTFASAVSQNSRWERGRLNALLANGPRFLWLAFRRRNPSALDAAIEQAVAPLSVCMGASGAVAIAGTLLKSRTLALFGFGSVAGQICYVLVGLRLAGAPSATYRALRSTPRYILWKCLLWLRAAAKSPAHWERTARLVEQ